MEEVDISQENREGARFTYDDARESPILRYRFSKSMRDVM